MLLFVPSHSPCAFCPALLPGLGPGLPLPARSASAPRGCALRLRCLLCLECRALIHPTKQMSGAKVWQSSRLMSPSAFFMCSLCDREQSLSFSETLPLQHMVPVITLPCRMVVTIIKVRHQKWPNNCYVFKLWF